jgi:hypothetical protein
MVKSPDEAHDRMNAHRILDNPVVPFLAVGRNFCGLPESAWCLNSNPPTENGWFR